MKWNIALATCIILLEYFLAYIVGVILALWPDALVSAENSNEALEKTTSSLLLLISTYMLCQFYKCSSDDQSRMEIIQSNLMFWGMFTLSLSAFGMMEHGSHSRDGDGEDEYDNAFKDNADAGMLEPVLFLCNCIGLLITNAWPATTSDDNSFDNAADRVDNVRARRRIAKIDNYDGLSKPLLDLPDDDKLFLQDSDSCRTGGTVATSSRRIYSIPNGMMFQVMMFQVMMFDINHSEKENTAVQQGDTTVSRLKGIGRLLQLAQPERTTLLIGCIVLGIRLPFSLSIQHFVAETFGALNNDDYDAAKHQVLLLVVAGSIDAALDFWCVYLFGKVNQSIIRELRINLFRAIIVQEMSFFDASSTGELLSRLSADCGSMAGDLTWFFRFSIEATVRVVVIIVYMFYRCPKLAATACSVIPLIALLNKAYGDWLGRNAKAVQDSLADANKIAQEAISCIQTVIAYTAEDVELDKYSKRVQRNYGLNMQQQFATALYYMLISTFLINTCVKAVLLYYGIVLYMRGELDAHILIAFMLYQDMLQEYCTNLANSYTSLIKSTGAGDKVFEILDRSPPPPATGSDKQGGIVRKQNSDEVSMDGFEARKPRQVSMELSNVVFSYPSRPDNKVLRGLNLKIPAGSTVALVGSSGCGKSTIVSLVERLYDPQEGSVMVDGVDLREMDVKAHRRRIGIVTQDPAMFSGSIASNIAYGNASVTFEEIRAAAVSANAHGFIEDFPDGYATDVGERGTQLSGGQKQRISIARAIVANPSILLLDEATSALDTDSEKMVQEALDRLLGRHSVTTVVVAHRLQTIRNADAIAVVHKGQVIELGNHETLMRIKNGRYRSMIGASSSVVDSTRTNGDCPVGDSPLFE
eukprot:CAMPEP_0116030176 /NCGR_PEP_ID=MMETSP0321-20121206/16685_1 /TAXON_ID=163516 /ORGANISM="Leptocylindrus danicus var. danicus, Strain B650" /LENGTH=868 /DNA_ID=CAMNT_0003504905 /DNA_START=33 /DNA_END=2639 /DNA_ORIENTATION=-